MLRPAGRAGDLRTRRLRRALLLRRGWQLGATSFVLRDRGSRARADHASPRTRARATASARGRRVPAKCQLSILLRERRRTPPRAGSAPNARRFGPIRERGPRPMRRCRHDVHPGVSSVKRATGEAPSILIPKTDDWRRMGEFSVAHLFIAVLGALVFIGILFALVSFDSRSSDGGVSRKT